MALAVNGSITVSFLLTGDTVQMCPLQKGVILLAACLPSPRTNMEKKRGLHKKWRLINTVDIRCV